MTFRSKTGSKTLDTETLSDFDVIPVIDLKDGVVVHARAGKQAHAGKRAEYRPLATPFGVPHDAVAIARALLAITFSPTLYVADLDAILGQGNNLDLCRELAEAFPETALWVDAGFSDVSDCAVWRQLGVTLVVGSESIPSLEAWDKIRESFGEGVVLSLDFDEEGLCGPPELLADPILWPDRVILMSLGRVGAEQGPDLVRLHSALAFAGHRAVFSAGGIANFGDIEQVADIGARGVLAATALHAGTVTQKEIAALLRERRSQS
jgi:phosphoribosylformimino-5-aminoimidazole carboxamide ribotide isomerase